MKVEKIPDYIYKEAIMSNNFSLKKIIGLDIIVNYKNNGSVLR